jgi:hypothetical protein
MQGTALLQSTPLQTALDATITLAVAVPPNTPLSHVGPRPGQKKKSFDYIE